MGEPLRKIYKDESDIFLAGSLVEPCCVAYNAVIERGGGVRRNNAVICGAGPVGLAACRELKTMGGATVIVSEPQPERAALAMKMGADYVIDPTKVDFTSEVLRLTDGMGASLYLGHGSAGGGISGNRAMHLGGQDPQRHRCRCRARRAKMPVTGEVLQVRRARIVGAQGHSGHGTFRASSPAWLRVWICCPLLPRKSRWMRFPNTFLHCRPIVPT